MDPLYRHQNVSAQCVPRFTHVRICFNAVLANIHLYDGAHQLSYGGRKLDKVRGKPTNIRWFLAPSLRLSRYLRAIYFSYTST